MRIFLIFIIPLVGGCFFYYLTNSFPYGWVMDSDTFLELARNQSTILRNETKAFILILQGFLYLGMSDYMIMAVGNLCLALGVAISASRIQYSTFAALILFGILAPLIILFGHLVLRYHYFFLISGILVYLTQSFFSSENGCWKSLVVFLTIIFSIAGAFLHPLYSIAALTLTWCMIADLIRGRLVSVGLSIASLIFLAWFFYPEVSDGFAGQIPYVGDWHSVNRLLIIGLSKIYETSYYASQASTSFSTADTLSTAQSSMFRLLLDRAYGISLMWLRFPFGSSNFLFSFFVSCSLLLVLIVTVFAVLDLKGDRALAACGLAGLAGGFVALLFSGSLGTFIRHFGKFIVFFIPVLLVVMDSGLKTRVSAGVIFFRKKWMRL